MRLRIDKTAILHPAKKVGHHALSKSKAFGAFSKGDLGAAIIAFVGFVGIGFTIWDHRPGNVPPQINVKPQVAAVVDPATAALQAAFKADDEDSTNKILERLNAQFAAQVPTATAAPPAIPKSVPPLSLHTQYLLPPDQAMVSPAHPPPAAPANPPPAATLPPITPVVMPVPINHPRPSPPVHPQLTKETPIVVESTWSDDDSTTVANSIRDDLRGDLFTVIDDQSGAAIFIKVEDVVEPPCSDASSCTLSVHVIGQYADGWKFFDEYFHGNEPETTLVSYGYDQARNEALTKAYNYLVSITKN